MAEAPLRETEHGLVPEGAGWYVVNAREAPWHSTQGALATFCHFEGDVGFTQLGINISVVPPGRPMCMYHYEVEQEDFLVLAGDGVVVVEGQERSIRAWDFFHCPANTNHVVVAGDEPMVVVCVGSRTTATREHWGAYTVDETAQRHGACVERETPSPAEAYAAYPEPTATRCRAGWLDT